MATQKKSSSKKSGKSAKSSKKDEFVPSEQGFGSVLGGWALVIFGLVLVFGCICSAYSGERENVLGPYLGKLIPDVLAFVFGRVASLMVASALVMWGAALVSVSRRGRFVRYAVGLSLLSVVFSFLFSLRNYGEVKVAKEALIQGGGTFGQFFNQFVAAPIFGKSLLMPLGISLFLVAMILVLAFGLRPRHFKFVVQTTAWFQSVFRKKD